jgi:SAM-dependent methyltransferase
MFRGRRLRRSKATTSVSEGSAAQSALGVTITNVNTTVSPNERMPAEDLPGYLATGRSALKAVQLVEMAARKKGFVSILDMACGHGRVLRWLQAAYPDARLTACDLLQDGVDFCASTFGATPVYSTPSPAIEIFPDRYDLIWVGSLLTHLDADRWLAFMQLWHDLLAPDGVLVVTTHGELVAERMRVGNLYGYPETSILRTLRTYRHAGFAFLEASPEEIDYGISIAKPEWVVRRLLEHPDFRLVLYTEALWANHQDVVAVVRRPLDARVAERPD